MTSLVVAAATVTAAFATFMSNARPHLKVDYDSHVDVPQLEVLVTPRQDDAIAIREVRLQSAAARPVANETPREEPAPEPAACNEWDPLAECL